MTLPNHLAGGFVFTGFFASLAGINILESPWLLGATALGAMLPDIDHTRSLIGRIFLPLSRFLNRRYGHRTLTHSLTGLFLFSLASGIVEQAYGQSQRLTVIASIAFFSHLVLDMMTLQGVVLFYPFFKNPCVIPGQANLRMRTGDVRRETLFFCLFLVLAFSLHDLFRQGFWNTYNRTFGSLKHLASEFVKSPYLIQVEYAYREGSRSFQGTGFCVEASERQATLITSEGFLRLDDAKQVIERVVPQRTRRSFRFDSRALGGLSLDSLNGFLSGKRIMALELRCNNPFAVETDSGIQGPATSFKGACLNRAVLKQDPGDGTGEYVFAYSDARIAALRQEMRLLQQEDERALAEFQSRQQELRDLEASAAGSSRDLFEAQQTANRIRELRKLKRPEGHRLKQAELAFQIQALEQEQAERNERLRLEAAQRLRAHAAQPSSFQGFVRWVAID